MKLLVGSNEWVADLRTWYRLNIRANRALRPWLEVVESGSAQMLSERIRSHIWVEKKVPWVGPHLRGELVTIIGSEIKQEISKL